MRRFVQPPRKRVVDLCAGTRAQRSQTRFPPGPGWPARLINGEAEELEAEELEQGGGRREAPGSASPVSHGGKNPCITLNISLTLRNFRGMEDGAAPGSVGEPAPPLSLHFIYSGTGSGPEQVPLPGRTLLYPALRLHERLRSLRGDCSRDHGSTWPQPGTRREGGGARKPGGTEQK